MTRRATLERVVEGALAREAARLGVLCWKLFLPGLAGLPDRLLLARGGRVAFVETKAPGEKPRPLQVYWIDKLRAFGFRVAVIDSPADVPGFFVEWLGVTLPPARATNSER